MIRNGGIMTRQTKSLFQNTRFMNRKTGSLLRNTRFMIRNTRCMTRIMWIYDSKYGPHESNYVDLWFETLRLWLDRPGHCSELPDLWKERPGHCSEIQDLWIERPVIVPKYQIYDSTYRVINFFRVRVFNDPEWHPPDDVLSSQISTTSPLWTASGIPSFFIEQT